MCRDKKNHVPKTKYLSRFLSELITYEDILEGEKKIKVRINKKSGLSSFHLICLLIE